ncbi:tetratricopeptide repeat domain-containing protein [Phlyctema vagabunda]|uniref:Tetratricopeptide repeat domain-containing protein n=1 Tax=Phlyctema vagabunda TaxID=108571 RepID=A0ABR4P2S5_9HELO
MQWLANPVKLKSKSTTEEPTLTEASWLVIFDNANSIGLVSEFWPTATSGSVLMTTRDPAAKDFCLGNGIILKPFSMEEATEFLLDSLNKDSDIFYSKDADLTSVLEKIGGLPLAIGQIAALIRRHFMTVHEFAQAFAQGAKEAGLSDYQASQYDGSYRYSLFTVWAFDTLDELAQGLLNVMSFLDPFGIQETILMADAEYTKFEQYPIGSAYITARSKLLKASLISRNIHANQVELHPLVREILQARMDHRNLLTHMSTAIGLLRKSWPREEVKFGHETSHREQSGRLVTHVLRLKDAYEKHLLSLQGEAELQWIELLRYTGWYLYERGEHETALPLFHQAFALARNLNPLSLPIIADILMSLAAIGIHASSGSEVLGYAQEHLKIRQQIYDQHIGERPWQLHYDLAMGIATVAMAYNQKTQFHEALEPAMKAVELYRASPRAFAFPAFAHAGWALWSLGRFKEAEDVLMEVVRENEIRNAGPSYGLAGILLPLGNVQASLGNLDEAAQTHGSAVKMYYTANGNNCKTAQARIKLAEHLARQGLTHEAWANYSQAIVSFGQNKYYKKELARALVKAARFRRDIANNAHADELFKRAQSAMYEVGIMTEVHKMSEDDLTNLVRIWSR